MNTTLIFSPITLEVIKIFYLANIAGLHYMIFPKMLKQKKARQHYSNGLFP